MNRFGQAFRRARQSAGLTLKQTAERSGWSLNHLAGIEQGRRSAPSEAGPLHDMLGAINCADPMPLRLLAAKDREKVEADIRNWTDAQVRALLEAIDRIGHRFRARKMPPFDETRDPCDYPGTMSPVEFAQLERRVIQQHLATGAVSDAYRLLVELRYQREQNRQQLSQVEIEARREAAGLLGRGETVSTTAAVTGLPPETVAWILAALLHRHQRGRTAAPAPEPLTDTQETDPR